METLLKNFVTLGNVTQVECESSNIDFVRYDAMNNILQVEFKGCKRYNYKNVPEEVWLQINEAKSIGAFVNTQLKGKFEAEKTEMNLFIENI